MNKIEKNKEVREFINSINEVQFTENEAFLYGVSQKIDEYIKYWNKTPINKDNHVLIKDQLKGAKDLILFKKEMEDIVLEDQRKSGFAKSEDSSLFEE